MNSGGNNNGDTDDGKTDNGNNCCNAGNQGRRKKLAGMNLLQKAVVKETAYQMAWTIPNFPQLISEFAIGEFFVGNTYSVNLPSGKKTNWILGCYPKGVTGSAAGVTTVYVSLATADITLKATITIGLLDREGAEVVLIETTKTMNSVDAAVVQGSTNPNSLNTEADRLLSNGELTIFVRMKIHLSPAIVYSTEVPCLRAAEEGQEHEDIYAAMLSEGCLDLGSASVLLVFEDGKQRCHTFPLAARSPVFRAMLTTNMLERNSGQVQLLSIKLKTGRDLLYYLYNGRLRAGSDLAGLLVIADQYDLPELKSWCEEGLAQSVSDTNYLQLLRFAEQNGIPRIKTAVIKYIAENATRLQA